MAISSSTLSEIMLDYDRQQVINHATEQRRKAEVFEACPEFAEVSRQVSSLSVSYATRLMDDERTSEEYHQKMQELASRKKELLVAAGFPADYLDSVFRCRDCKDTGYIGASRCHCLTARLNQIRYDQSNIRLRLENAYLEDLSEEYYEGEDLDNFRMAMESATAFIKSFTDVSGENLLLYGPVGTGKTYLSDCIAHALLESGRSVIYYTAQGLFDALSRYTFDSSGKETLYNTLEDLYNCDLVIIDDLGTEIGNSFTDSRFFNLINERALRGRSVIISTNFNVAELKNRYSDRVFSRLASNYTFRKLSGPDIRLLKNI